MALAKLFLLNTNDDTDLLQMLPFALPDDMREAALQYRQLSDRNNFVAARWILQQFFQSVADGPTLADIRHTGSGKPFVNNVHFSIAHTNGLVGVIVSTSPVGLDIERIRGMKNLSHYEEFFSVEEIAGLQDAGPEAFFRSWTTKEAVLKLTGAGITDPENAKSIRIEAGNTASYNNRLYRIWSFIPGAEFVVTAAMDMSDELNELEEYYLGATDGNKLTFTRKDIGRG